MSKGAGHAEECAKVDGHDCSCGHEPAQDVDMLLNQIAGAWLTMTGRIDELCQPLQDELLDAAVAELDRMAEDPSNPSDEHHRICAQRIRYAQAKRFHFQRAEAVLADEQGNEHVLVGREDQVSEFVAERGLKVLSTVSRDEVRDWLRRRRS